MAQVVLADEINRATPKTQSSLLECMDERQATIDGVTHQMPDPFLVIATQNPIEYEGTFALPEAQLDRFMLRIRMGYPAADRRDRHPRRAEADPPARRSRARSSGSTSCARCRRRSARSTSNRRSATTSSGWSTAPATTPTSTSAPRRAARSRCTGRARRWPACSAATTSSPTTSSSLAEPALAHRLIIKTSSTIHDVQPGQVVRELLETLPVEPIRAPSAARGDPGAAARGGRRAADAALTGACRPAIGR